jgi:hypothetical protein
MPEETKKGDLNCILPGYSVPVVLREVGPRRKGKEGKDDQTGKVYYLFLGECYVYGMMDGEAFAIRNQGHIEYQTFEIH